MGKLFLNLFSCLAHCYSTTDFDSFQQIVTDSKWMHITRILTDFQQISK